MKRFLLITLIIAVSFCSGFAFRAILSGQDTAQLKTGRVTGIGGIFFKCKDTKKLRAWYQQHLGLNTNDYGAVFEWYQGADSTRKGFTQWSPFKETTKYFEPSTRDFMINYRVDNMDVLVAALRREQVPVLDSVQTFEYGKFVHIQDPEGNKIELWEPYDAEYEKLGRQMNAKTTK